MTGRVTPAVGTHPGGIWSDDVVREVVDIVPDGVAVALGVLSHLGSVWFVVPAVLAAFLTVRTGRATAWLGIVGGGYGVMIAVKSLVAIDRPGVDPPVAPDSLHPVLAVVYEPSVEIATTAFPSGHAFVATVVWGLFVFESRRCTRTRRIAIATAAITLVGIARVALGVHYPIDVVAGVAGGAVYLAGVVAAIERAQQPVAVALGVGAVAAWLGAVRDPRMDAVLLCGCLLGALLAWLVLDGAGQTRLALGGAFVSTAVVLLALFAGLPAVAVGIAGVIVGGLVVAVPLWTQREPVDNPPIPVSFD